MSTGWLSARPTTSGASIPVAFQDRCKVDSQAASLVVFQVASQVGLAKEASGNSPRFPNSQHQDGLAREAREASGARLQHNPFSLSSLHLSLSSLHPSSLHLSSQSSLHHSHSQLLLRLRDP